MVEVRGFPVMGTDAAANADDTYAEVIAAASLPGMRRCIQGTAMVATNDAILSFDGGTTDHIPVKAGEQVHFGPCQIDSVHGKNAVAASDYTALFVAIW